MHNVFVDFETTSLDPWKGDILTGHMILTDDNYEIKDELEIRIKPSPNTEWSEESALIHGIDRKATSDWNTRLRVCGELLQWFSQNLEADYTQNKLIMMANPNGWWSEGVYHIPWFDWNFLFSMYWKENLMFALQKYFTQQSCETLWYKAKQHKIKPNLKDISEYLGVQLDHHDAKSDTYALYECWKTLTRERYRKTDSSVSNYQGDLLLEESHYRSI